MRRGDGPPHRAGIRAQLLPATTVSGNFVHFTSVVGVSCECRFPSGVIFTFGAHGPPAPHLGGAVRNVPILPCSCHKLIYTEVLLSLSAYGFQGGKWLTSESFFSLRSLTGL